jgi:hypothetical protein
LKRCWSDRTMGAPAGTDDMRCVTYGKDAMRSTYN